jgi:hypothetical protein
MSIKTVSDADTGDSTHVGGADWNKVAKYFNGTAAVINANINSDTTFQNNRMKFQNGSFVSTVSTANITSNNTMAWPQPQGQTSDRLLSVYSNDTIFNKTIASWDNNVAGVVKFPSIRKFGMIAAGPVAGGGAGEGLFFGFLDMPALPVRGWDATFGSYWRYNSTTTANTPTGTRVPARWILKEFLPFYRAKFRMSATTNTRLYFGLSYETSIPATDTPTDNPEACMLIGWRSSDANVVIISNAGPSGGSGTSPTVTQTTVTKSSMANQVRQFEINFSSATSCTVRILDGNATTALYVSPPITTNLPQDAMSPSLVMNNTTGTAVDFDVFFEELDHK